MTELSLHGKNTRRPLFGLLSVFILAVVIWYSFESQLPSANQYTSGAPTSFSQQNALKHLIQISKEPHYLGSLAHSGVRQYLVSEIEALGLKVEIFEHVGSDSSRRFYAANTQNIIAKIPGKTAGNALALASHYDSAVHSSLGASDAGSGVVTILEGVRAFLATGEQPENDIIIIFTDGEELGLLGAQAFVNYHPWANNVKLVLNFEARGSGGPSYMIAETNGGNAKLIQAFANAKVAHPAANSLMYSIYKLLPNDTDLTIFREDGDIQGYNFAFMDDHFDYHTAQDSVSRLDQASLNHQAEYLMAMLGYFADADLTELSTDEDLVYFNFPIIGMVFYPFAWVISMAVLGCVALLPVCYIGIKRQHFSLVAIGRSFVPLILSLVSAGLIGYLGWQALLIVFPQYADIPQNFTYNGHWIIATFVSLTLAATLAIYQGFSRYCSANNRYVAPIILWLLLNLFVAIVLPGAGFLILPIYFALALLYIKVLSRCPENTSATGSMFALVLSLPTAIIFAPFIPAFVIGLGLNALFIGTILACLLIVIVLPVLLENSHSIGIKYLAVVLAVIFFAVSAFQSTYSADRKKPNSINYILDIDEGRAFWISSNRSVDGFTKQFFTAPDRTGPWDKSIYPESGRSPVRQYQKAKVLPLASATVVVEKDSVVGAQRHISLRISPNRATNLLRLYTFENILIKRMSVNGHVYRKNNQLVEKAIKPGFFFGYDLSQPFESIVVEFTVASSDPLSIKLYESAFDIFDTFDEIEPRGDLYMPEPFMLNDATIIGQNVKVARTKAD
jgi:hypothetical protein